MSRKALQLHPQCWLLYRTLARALTALGEYDQARRSYGRAILLDHASQIGLLAELAYVDAVAGDGRTARTFLQLAHSSGSRPHISPVSIAHIHIALGNKDRALDCLEQACWNRDWSLSALKQDHRFDPVRTTRRFARLVAEVRI